MGRLQAEPFDDGGRGGAGTDFGRSGAAGTEDRESVADHRGAGVPGMVVLAGDRSVGGDFEGVKRRAEPDGARAGGNVAGLPDSEDLARQVTESGDHPP